METNICTCCCACCCYEPEDERGRQSQCSCFDAFHAKTIEILLIIGFLGSDILVSASLIVGSWAKISYAIFFVFIMILLLSIVGSLFIILIRIWRANNSILTTKYSKSVCLSRLLYLIIILSLLLSIIQDIFISWVVDPEKKYKIIRKRRLNNINDNEEIFAQKDKDPENSKEYSSAMLSITYNEFADCLMGLFLYHLINRIKNKAIYGPSLAALNQQQQNIGQEQHPNLEQNQIGFNPNQVNNINIRNDNLNDKGIIKNVVLNNRSERVNIFPNNKNNHKKKFKILKKINKNDNIHHKQSKDKNITSVKYN